MIQDIGWVLTVLYAWLKAGHIIFVIFWIAGLFMLPRYYVYHQESSPGSDEEKSWVEREAKLRNIIINPAMILAWTFGILLVWINYANGIALLREPWFLAKFAIVFALSGYHGWMVGYGKTLAAGKRPLSGKALRIMNEVPGIAVVIVVILVIVRPFS